MTPAQTAEQDWAAYYLLLRGAPLSQSAVLPDHFGTPEIAGWYRAARKIGNWVHFDELGIDTDTSVKLTQRVVLPTHVPELERRITEGWALRRTQSACAAFLDSTRGEGAASFQEASQRLLEALTEAQSGMPVSSVSHGIAGKDAIAEWLESAQATEPRAIPLPWPKLHGHTHGLPRKKVTIVGGRSSEHKTTTARSWAVHAADKAFRVLYWTMEDNTGDLAGRTIADRVGYVDTTALATGGWPREHRPTGDEWSAFLGRAEKHLEGNVGRYLRYLDTSAPRRHQVLTALRAEAARGLDMVVLDFVQLIRPDDDRTRVTPEWWRETLSLLNGVAQDCDLVALLVSQIEKTGSATSEEANRLPRAVEMPFGAQLWQGTYAIVMVGFEKNELKLKIEKWKSAEAKHGNEGQVVIGLRVDPKQDRITEA